MLSNLSQIDISTTAIPLLDNILYKMATTLTEIFPKDVADIICDYVYQLEHVEKFKYVCFELCEMYWIRKRVVLNIQFNSMFFPNFYEELGINGNH